MGNSRKVIKRLSIIMIVVFAIGMLASAILFLKNNIKRSVVTIKSAKSTDGSTPRKFTRCAR